MSKLRMAVVGTGFWGRNHVRVLSELPEVELAAVCDADMQKAKAVSEKYGITPYDNSREMYKKESVDAVTLCVWSTKLAEEALKALHAKKHVLVEKPMASSTKEARKILDAAQAEKLRLAVGFIERFNPGVNRVKKAIEKSQIGAPVSITVKRVSKWPQRIGDVGVLKDTAIHDIDTVRYILDEEPLAVYARAGNLRHEKFEDYVQIMLAFSGGKSAFLEANWLTPYKIRKLTVTGSEAIISLDYITQDTTVETSGQTLTPRYEWEEPLKLELQHFVECVLKGKEPRASGLDGLKALKIAEAVLKSASNGCVVKLANKQ
jgi:UDP-N-acetylglucosamine 3-dehydrogenase